MGKEWCKFEQNRMKAIKVDGISESWNHRIMDMLKTVYPLKLRFVGGMKKKKKKKKNMLSFILSRFIYRSNQEIK